YDAAVSTSIRYYRLSNPIISQITFVPRAGLTSRVTILYTAYGTNGVPYDGRIVVAPSAPGNLGALTYYMAYDEPFNFGDAGLDDDIRALVRQAAGSSTAEAFSYAVFSVPAASDGVIYKNYSGGASRRQGIAEGEAFHYSSSPAISDLTFTAASDGNIRLNYTAYTASGSMYSGRITLKAIVLPDSWSRDEVGALAMRGVIPDSLLSNYDRPITRAEYTALLVRTFDYSGAASGAQTRTAAFADTRGNPYARQVARAYALGIVDGISEVAFDPDSPLTREAAAKILCATVALISGEPMPTGGSVPYADSGAISDWALPYVAYAHGQGLMIGDNANNFNPQANLSREEAMALIERMIDNYVG
ncbi:MAG: S-layer homology domain-containing protein, partial [Oscillospiraceae bacterium]|nr:S-layer homology domain-containing protein [Oscillospiraceae bacterium]